MLRHDGRRNQGNDQRNGDRQQNVIVKIAEDRDEVRNEVNRRKRIGSDAHRDDFRIPRHAAISRSEIKRVSIAPDRASPVFPAIDHS